MIVLGTLDLVFARQVYNFTGAIDFVESHFPGYTQGFIKLVGVVLVIVGLLFFTGVGGSITGPLFEGIQHTFRIGG